MTETPASVILSKVGGRGVATVPLFKQFFLKKLVYPRNSFPEQDLMKVQTKLFPSVEELEECLWLCAGPLKAGV